MPARLPAKAVSNASAPTIAARREAPRIVTDSTPKGHPPLDRGIRGDPAQAFAGRDVQLVESRSISVLPPSRRLAASPTGLRSGSRSHHWQTVETRLTPPGGGAVDVQPGGFRSEGSLLGIGVAAAARKADRVNADKPPHIRRGASRRNRACEPRTERRPNGLVPRTCRLLHRSGGAGND